MLSLACELEVYPFRVHDTLAAMRALLASQEPGTDDGDLDAAVWGGRRFGGYYELPERHCDAIKEGDPELSDWYLTDGAEEFVRAQIRPPSFLVHR